MQTIYDCRRFMILCLIILTAFGNFIFIADVNNYKTGVTYSQKYFGVQFLDAIINVYDFGALGDI